MSNTQNILQKFQAISLEEMNDVKLLDRVDRKFICSIKKFETVLEKLTDYYYVLEINGKRNLQYSTVYFDSDNFLFYTQHHNGKGNRNKIRQRSYIETGEHFFEIKHKSNKGRTTKYRFPVMNPEPTLTDQKVDLIKKYVVDVDVEKIFPKITINFKRITLVSKLLNERITIDTELNYDNGIKTASYPNIVIFELKQSSRISSHASNIMREERIYKRSISKYCLGIASLYEGVKINNFKVRFNHVNKICNENT
ncbi:MAG TPA: polyphosphate polymerase domain-containing protein [Bacteroidales bacterium]|nr:polyphosphate polymerase domain-containing protein [Bacteroidales bacterium]HOR60569.1 polyphosphate polymerase domain-containing protein [Bacteroidales bacterium]HPL05288.1 polyphosphate polymerase domain-containing protein [Bacteroidales bacterium]